MEMEDRYEKLLDMLPNYNSVRSRVEEAIEEGVDVDSRVHQIVYAAIKKSYDKISKLIF